MQNFDLDKNVKGIDNMGMTNINRRIAGNGMSAKKTRVPAKVLTICSELKYVGDEHSKKEVKDISKTAKFTARRLDAVRNTTDIELGANELAILGLEAKDKKFRKITADEIKNSISDSQFTGWVGEFLINEYKKTGKLEYMRILAEAVNKSAFAKNNVWKQMLVNVFAYMEDKAMQVITGEAVANIISCIHTKNTKTKLNKQVIAIASKYGIEHKELDENILRRRHSGFCFDEFIVFHSVMTPKNKQMEFGHMEKGEICCSVRKLNKTTNTFGPYGYILKQKKGKNAISLASNIDLWSERTRGGKRYVKNLSRLELAARYVRTPEDVVEKCGINIYEKKLNEVFVKSEDVRVVAAFVNEKHKNYSWRKSVEFKELNSRLPIIELNSMQSIHLPPYWREVRIDQIMFGNK